MMSGKNTPGIGLARVSLDELYVKPAAAFIRDRGGRIKCGVSGTGLLISGQGRVVGVALSDGTATEADAVICAVPPWDFARLAGAYAGLADFADEVKEMTPCPALSVHLWLDPDMLDDEFASLPDSVFQWVYNVGHLMGKGEIGRQHLCLLRLCAGELMGKSSAELVALALEDIKHVAGRPGRVEVVHSRVDWEQDASVAFHPGSERVRRRASRPMPGLFLAGDWVRPGLPVSFENAVASGVAAARNVTALKPVR
jgi:15-cis-phytoene desaturase